MTKQLTLLFLGLFWAGTALLAQAGSSGQTVKGTIIDKQSEMPLIGATIECITLDPMRGASSDVDGRFSIADVPVGRHDFRVSYIGYQSITVPNIIVTAGKEVLLNLSLEESVETLNEIVVTADSEKDRAQNEMATVSARTFSLEEVNRFSGGRNDVGRLAGNFAGVATADDSRNDIVIRGNSPTGLLWRLEGIPIPNPNHFSTLGTTGGPVSALNPNLLRNSDFLTGAFPAEYGDALSGVFDLGFRSGNPDKHEFTLQIGAVSGIEAMAEGPISQANNATYVVAARYSFLGLAQAMNLNIGTNATPNYQDLAFKVDFGKGKSRWSLFGIGGLSDIDFLRDEVDENDLFAADNQDSYARSGFGVAGLRHNLLLDERSYIRTVIAYSTSRNRFWVDEYFEEGQPTAYKDMVVDITNANDKASISSYYNRKVNSRLTLRTGVLAEQSFSNLFNRSRDNTPDVDGDGMSDWFTSYDFEENMTLLQGFAQAQYKPAQNLTLNLGLHAQALTLNSTFALEPRAAINWQMAPRHMLSFGYGLHSQTVPLPVLLLTERQADGSFVETNRELGFTQSHHFVLGYDLKLADSWRLKAETYYQAIVNVPVESTPSTFSLLNVGADFAYPDDTHNLVNEGEGYNVGVELTVEKFFSQGYYALLTASLFDSQYKGSDGEWRSTAFNNQYVLNILAGKEFKVGKRNAFTLDTKLTTAGGQFYTPVDLAASQAAGFEVRDNSLAFTERIPDYFRWDVKVGFRINSAKRKLSHQFFFDIQNVTNNENVFARRYNANTNSVNDVYQLGFFPDFMYRLQF